MGIFVEKKKKINVNIQLDEHAVTLLKSVKAEMDAQGISGDLADAVRELDARAKRTVTKEIIRQYVAKQGLN